MRTLITPPRFAGLRRLLVAAVVAITLLPNLFGFHPVIAAPTAHPQSAIETPPDCAHKHRATAMNSGEWTTLPHTLDKVDDGFNIDYQVAAKRQYLSNGKFTIDGEAAMPILENDIIRGWKLVFDSYSQHMQRVEAMDVNSPIVVQVDPDHSGSFQSYFARPGCV